MGYCIYMATGTKVRNLWMNLNGAIVCEEHAGHGLAASIKAHPSTTTHITDTDQWALLTVADLAALATYGAGDCELCCRG